MQACLLLAVFNTASLPALYFGHAWLIDAGGHFIHSDFATSGPRASSHSRTTRVSILRNSARTCQHAALIARLVIEPSASKDHQRPQ
jgi:hypothetical protein